jgi:hypothetical protein
VDVSFSGTKLNHVLIYWQEIGNINFVP